MEQLITKNAIARNFDDPELTAAAVIPTDTMALSDEPAASRGRAGELRAGKPSRSCWRAR